MGKLTISLDFELGWGAIESQMWQSRETRGVYEDFRPVFKRLLRLLDELEVPLTWATVGAMISDPKASDFSHLPDAFRERAVDFLALAKPLTRDGRDLMDQLLKMNTQQDIGLHSFSHTRFQESSFTVESKLIDLQRGTQSLKDLGVTPKSFVFPVNQVQNLELLPQVGLSIARTPPPTLKTGREKLIQAATGKTPSAKRQTISAGFDTEAGSMLYNWRNSWLRKILIDHQIRAAFRKAKISDYHLHLWLHPFNLAEIKGLEQGLYSLLKKAATLRDAGKISIEPMSEPE